MVVGVLIIGFGGVSTQVDVKYGACEAHYRKYQLKPFLPPVVCAAAKMTDQYKNAPCGDFAEHRTMNAHIQMLECLCRDPTFQAGNIVQYTKEFYTDHALPTEAFAICNARPKVHNL